MARAFFSFAAAWGLATACFGATITVDLNGGADFTDIQSAIDAAVDGDTVLVKAGEYVSDAPIDFNRDRSPLGPGARDPGDPETNVKNLHLLSESGPDVTVLRMSETPADPKRGSVLLFKSGETDGSTVEGFTITGGKGMASVWCDGDWCRLGGGIHIVGSSPRIVDCRIVANSVDQGWGAGIYLDESAAPLPSSSTFIGCRVAANTLGPKGNYPGVLVFGSPTFIDCTIEDHAAVDKEAAFACRSGAAILRRCTIRGNASGGFSGVGYGGAHDPSPTLIDCLIEGNCARYGGGIRTEEESDGTFIRCTIRGNYATEAGGGVSCASPSSTVVGGVNTFKDCRIEGNYAPQGGGLFISKRDATVLDGCLVLGNGAERSGGASLNDDRTTMVNCVIAGNTGSDGAGAMWLNGATIFTNCTFAVNPGADPRSDLVCVLSQVRLVNCIFAPIDASATCLLEESCYEGDSPGFVLPGEFDFSRFRQVTIGGIPRALPDFIVEEPDFRLLPSSPAVDGGTPEGAPAADIEGRIRPCGEGVDIGAYESGDCWPPPSCADLNADGFINVADPVCLLRWLFSGGPPLSCAEAAGACGDLNGDKSVDMEDAVDLLAWLFLGTFEIVCPPSSCEDEAPQIAGFTFLGCNVQGYPEYTHDPTGIIFVRLPGGKFNMGSTENEPYHQDDEGPVHEVTLSPFLIAKFEVTQGQWKAVMGNYPSYFDGTKDWTGNPVDPPDDRDSLPVEQVSWYDIQGFEDKTGLTLPSEAQWEYAARAGTEAAFSFGSGESCADWECAACAERDEYMWYCGNGDRRSHVTGQKAANLFGLHDMHGNVWEWCEDVYDSGFYPRAEAAGPDPLSPWGSGFRVVRGGGWWMPAKRCRSSHRSWGDPRISNDLGFRPAFRPLP